MPINRITNWIFFPSVDDCACRISFIWSIDQTLLSVQSAGRVEITYYIEPIGKRYRNFIHCIPKYTLVWLTKENQFRIFPWPFSFIQTKIDECILWFYLLIRLLKIWIRRRSNRQQITLKVVFLFFFSSVWISIESSSI